MKIKNRLLVLIITFTISYAGQIGAVDAEALGDELKKKVHQGKTDTSKKQIILTRR